MDIKLGARKSDVFPSDMTSGHSKVFSTVVQSLLEDGLSVRFRAAGRSMLPALRDGELLTVAPARTDEIDIGDVLLCETRRGPVAHRVLSVERRADGEKKFTLRGDASLECDGPVAAPQVRGKIVSVERAGRSVSLSIAGGRWGRLALMMALRARPVLAEVLRTWLAPARLASGAGSATSPTI